MNEAPQRKKFNLRIAALIITYNPDLQLLKKNICAIQRNLKNDYLIVDNGSDVVANIINEYGLDHVISLEKNLGIAAAQNIGFRHLGIEKFDWVLLLDQDSIIPDYMVKRMTTSKVFNQENTGILSIAYKNQYYVNKGIIQNNEVISSGSLVRIKAWELSGGMDEELFIDYVDFDFNARVKMAGFLIYQDTSIVMKHEIGETIYAPKLGKLLHLGKRQGYFYDHSAFRLFYFYKNSIVVKKRYPNFFNQGKKPVWLNIKRLREIIVYKKPRFKKFVYAVKGIYAGAKYRPENDRHFQQMLEYINEKN